MIINRKLYKEIKKFDHNDMEKFLTEVYNNGVKDGIMQNSLDFKIIKERLLTIRGIGEVKANEIIELLKIGNRG